VPLSFDDYAKKIKVAWRRVNHNSTVYNQAINRWMNHQVTNKVKMSNLFLKSPAILSVLMSLPADISVLMSGPTGVGKSAVAHSFAAALGLPLIDVRGSIMDEASVGGIPDFEGSKENEVTYFLTTSWFKRCCDEPCVLLLDEFNRAMPQVMQSFFQIVLDRELGNDRMGNPRRLHPETRIIACINSGNEYDVNEMDPALLRRFWVCEFEPDTQEWINWARRSKTVPEIILSYISTYPNELRQDPKSVANGTVAPNPASWTRFANSLAHAKINLDDYAGERCPENVYWIGAGFLGTETTAKFVGYIKNMQKAISALDVLNNYSKVRNRIDKTDAAQMTGIAEEIMNYWVSPKWDNTYTDAQKKNLRQFVLDAGDEIVGHFWVKGAQLAEACGDKEKTPAIAKAIHAAMADRIVEIATAAANKENK
jgi:hypothetical protein